MQSSRFFGNLHCKCTCTFILFPFQEGDRVSKYQLPAEPFTGWKNFFKEWSKEKEIEIPNLEKHYEIVVFNTSEDYDIGGLSYVPNKLICFLI